MSAAEKLQISFVQIDNIRPSLTNPRKTFADIDDLAADLKLRGILLPLIVRPDPTQELAFELVAGERRWRAARKAELLEVPVMVRELNDQEVLEIQIVENAKRSDIHPVEEAEAYRTLHEKHGLSADEIAVKVGKSRRVVYERMQLCSLNSTVREAALSGTVPPTIAVLLARVPPQFQEGALKEITTKGHYRNAGVMTHDEAREFIVSQYTLALSEAQWNLKDEALVPEAGSCAKCLKRTGNQPELFADIAKKDTCTDPDCFAEKKRVYVKLTIAKAAESGRTVLATTKETKQALKSGEYVDLDKEQYLDGEYTTARKLLGKKKIESALAAAPEGTRELARKEDIEKALPKLKQNDKHAPDYEKEEAKRQQERELKQHTATQVALSVAQKLRDKKLSKAHWFIVAEDLATNGGDGHAILCRLLLDRAASEIFENDKTEMRGALAKMNTDQLQSVVLAAVLCEDVWSFANDNGGPLSEMAKLLGIDKKKIAAEVKGQLKAEVKEELGIEPEPVAKKPKAKKKGGK